MIGPYEFPTEISMDQWRSKFSESFSLDRHWSIECSSLQKFKKPLPIPEPHPPNVPRKTRGKGRGTSLGLRSTRPATEVSRALRARESRGVSPRVSPKTGVYDGVCHGVSPRRFGPRAPECPKSVPRVSPECQKSVSDTLGTLSGHFLDTPEPGARRAPGTPRGTLRRTPPFSGTLSGTLPGTLGPEGPERPL